ncbi:hypothetical protein TNCV_809081 [Trichonephila clavipes]|nr:hypothetical protein TNCV_809081 [Trichonephila clavipes]
MCKSSIVKKKISAPVQCIKQIGQTDCGQLLVARVVYGQTRGSAKDVPCASTNADDRNLICYYAHERIEPQLQLNSDPSSLQALKGWYQGEPCVEDFTNLAFLRGNQPFASLSSHVIDGNVAVGTSTCPLEHVINGEFSL